MTKDKVTKKSIVTLLRCVKSVFVRSCVGPHFPLVRMVRIRTEYGEIRRIQSECRKMRTRITPNTDTVYAVMCVNVCGEGLTSIFRQISPPISL